MLSMLQFVALLAPPKLQFVHALFAAFSPGAVRDTANYEFIVATFAMSTALVGLAFGFWAAWMHIRLGKFLLAAENERAAAEQDLRLRDALLDQSRQSMVVLAANLRTPISFGDGAALLEDCLAGRDAHILASALAALMNDGTPFEFSVRTESGNRTVIHALPLMGRAAIFLSAISKFEADVDYHAALDVLPIPVWVRDPDLQLCWGNCAFLSAVDALSPQQAVDSNAMLDSSERVLATIARDGTEVLNAKRYSTFAGQRRALTMNLSRLPDSSIACSALDVTDAIHSEARLQIAADATADMLDRMSIAIAVFAADQRLMSNNSAYARLWNLEQVWLDMQPTQSDVLDRLHEARFLPEHRDFAGWKRHFLELFEDGRHQSNEYWHLPGGQSLHVVSQSHLQGGLFFTFDDVSEAFQLKASLTSVMAVQRSTLETLEDAVAIFEPDGRLTLHNHAFEKLWRLTDAEVSDHPHFAKLAALCLLRLGRDNIWDIVASAVTATNPERYGQWGNITRSDGKVIALAPSRLPDGATLVTFRDMTDIERFRSLLRESSHSAA